MKVMVMHHGKTAILASIALLLALPMATNAAPITIEWKGTFNDGVKFDGIDVSGLAWTVRQIGDTDFADIEPSAELGHFFGFTTVLDILGISGLTELVADNASGFRMTPTQIFLTDDPFNFCYLCDWDIVNPIDHNSLDAFSEISINNDFAYFSGAFVSGPLYSFGGGRVFSGNYYRNQLTSVSATVAVPEPGTLVLLGIGLAGVGFARRRRTQ